MRGTNALGALDVAAAKGGVARGGKVLGDRQFPRIPAELRSGRGARWQLEGQRLLSVERSGLLGTGDEERFDRIVRRAQEIFGVSAAGISLIGEDEQFMRSFVGPLVRTIDRHHAFCNVTIQGEDLLIIPDTLEDPRFSTNPFVVGDPHIRFYAGCPLRGPGGWFIGTLCVIDQAPRSFTIADQRILRALAIEAELELNDNS